MVLVLGDMLFDGLPGLPPDAPVFMMEDRFLCTRIRHHQQKLVLFLAAMRCFRDRLREQGRRVRYVSLDENGDASILDRLRDELKGESELTTYRIADPPIRRALAQLCAECGVALREVPNPMFLTPPDEWSAYQANAKRLLMGDFYQRQRKKMRLLVEGDGKPVGGRWSFDEDNRKPLPKGHRPPAVWGVEPNSNAKDVMALVADRFPDHPGRAADFAMPVTHEQAEDWLDAFLEDRLDLFGDYEDALPAHERVVYHGVLTPMLNTGLLTPNQVLDATMARHARRPVPLNSLEGFVRQIVGWREFMKGMSEYYDRTPHPDNYFGHTRLLRPCWWDGTTGLAPLDLAIRRAVDHAWIHHIERLMVVGAAMLMSEVHPRAAFDWFMEMTMDSADWVMVPCVFGMSQFADGGVFATKPYLSASAYLKRMGFAEPGPWTDVWDGLYWRFVCQHRSLFEQNPRMKAMVGGLDRMTAARRETIFSAAEAFIERATQAP